MHAVSSFDRSCSPNVLACLVELSLYPIPHSLLVLLRMTLRNLQSAPFPGHLICSLTSPSANSLLTTQLQDIVHGDVKCENVLIFEEHDDSNPERESTTSWPLRDV